MTWYIGYYGSWANGGTVRRISLGEGKWAERAGTYDRKEMFSKAQEVANENNVVVTIIAERPNGHGISVDTFKVTPVAESVGALWTEPRH